MLPISHKFTYLTRKLVTDKKSPPKLDKFCQNLKLLLRTSLNYLVISTCQYGLHGKKSISAVRQILQITFLYNKSLYSNTYFLINILHRPSKNTIFTLLVSLMALIYNYTNTLFHNCNFKT